VGERERERATHHGGNKRIRKKKMHEKKTMLSSIRDLDGQLRVEDKGYRIRASPAVLSM